MGERNGRTDHAVGALTLEAAGHTRTYEAVGSIFRETPAQLQFSLVPLLTDAESVVALMFHEV